MPHLREQARAMYAKLPNPRQLLQLSLLSPNVALPPSSDHYSYGELDFFAGDACPDPQLSCHNTTAVDTCCFNYPGGQLLQTQFWDTSPAVGPDNSWTVHGLWPDLCDGSYDASCDADRAYTNITDILNAFGATALLAYMDEYWLPNSGTSDSFWSHEWSKHGTCISTLEPDCYASSADGYTPQQEVVQFFNLTVNLFQTLDTYATLAAANVLPNSDQTYSLDQLSAPLAAMHGAPVTLRCSSGGTQLDEVWYHFNVKGSVQTGQFVAADPDGSKTNCQSDGIAYLPKSAGGDNSAAAPGDL